jgi:hypothetical protein
MTVSLNSGMSWKSQATINLKGALGEMSVQSSILQQRKIGQLALTGAFRKAYPELYQRDYYANTTAYTWDNRLLYSHLNLGGKLNLNVKNTKISLSASYEFTDKLPLYVGNEWRQDTLNQLSIFAVKAATSFVYKKLFFQPSQMIFYLTMKILKSSPPKLRWF